eukprot:1151649-Pelagomonas_calceolata.AAC.5
MQNEDPHRLSEVTLGLQQDSLHQFPANKHSSAAQTSSVMITNVMITNREQPLHPCYSFASFVRSARTCSLRRISGAIHSGVPAQLRGVWETVALATLDNPKSVICEVMVRRGWQQKHEHESLPKAQEAAFPGRAGLQAFTKVFFLASRDACPLRMTSHTYILTLHYPS